MVSMPKLWNRIFAMNTVTIAKKIMRGMRNPSESNLGEVALAHDFIASVADALVRSWNDPDKFDETCQILLGGFLRGRLALMARGDQLLILDNEGNTKITVPVREIRRKTTK